MAFLGVGRMGVTHLRNLAGISRVRVIAVADLITERAERGRTMTGAELAVTDSAKAIEHPSVDAVVIVTPTGTHAQLIEQGIVEIEALCYIRGRSIPNRYFVLDEAQQLTPLEAKTVVTRMSKGSKLVMVGDPAQIDNPYVDSRSNGLVFCHNRMKGQVLSAHVKLTKGERSKLAELAADLL